MTIRHLRIFIAVTDTGKMSAAAKKLFISQPTVSQAIKELEEHYGGLLFERLSKKLYITPRGKKLLSYARSIVKQFDDMEEMMLRENYVETIRIGATITVGNCLLGEVIHEFKKRSPRTEIYSYVNNTKDVEEHLLTSELDIAIVEGTVKSPDLISLPKVNDFLVLICSPKHPFAQRDTIRLEELGTERFAMRERGSGTRALFEGYMLDKGVPLRIALEANSSDTIKKAVIDNQCLAVISVRLVEEEIKNGKLHVIVNTDSNWNRSFSVVYHKNKVITDEMRNLMEVLDNYRHVDILQGVNVGKLVAT